MSICQTISAQLGGLFKCSQYTGGTRITTPFYYPDGDAIDLFYTEENGTQKLTDHGEALRWLWGQTMATKRTQRQNRLIDDVCMTHAVMREKGELFTTVLTNENAANAVMRLAQAVLGVAGLWVTGKNRLIESVSDEVETFLFDRGIDFVRGRPVAGRSGKQWKVDFQTRTPQATALVTVLSTGSRGSSQGIIASTIDQWLDLSDYSELVPPSRIKLVSLFDDTVNVWSEEDFKRVGYLSTVARWQSPDEFVQILSTPGGII